jgi:acetyltransferase-like isoleucine patch superfamily enzyme
MKDVGLDTLLGRIGLKAPGKLVEALGYYSEQSSKFAGSLRVFCSAQVKGDVSHPTLAGKGNALIRGYKSESNNSKISFSGQNNIVFFGPHSRVNNSDIRITANNSIFYFGAFSTVESMTVILSGDEGKIEIGDYCMLSARIIIDRSDHHSIYDTETGERINDDKDVTISDHVWISRDVRISKGSWVGSNSVVGQASLVTGRLESGNAYGGVPARCLREGITWSRMKSNSIKDMEKSDRHINFLKSVQFIKDRSRDNDLAEYQ